MSWKFHKHGGKIIFYFNNNETPIDLAKKNNFKKLFICHKHQCINTENENESDETQFLHGMLKKISQKIRKQI